jgi:uncharacterized protein YfkK (UPF0435 family)
MENININIESILEKLNKITDNKNVWKNWNLDEQLKLLNIYLMICKKETFIFDLISQNHNTNLWEDIFRDYDESYLDDKISGVEIAIDIIKESIKKRNLL